MPWVEGNASLTTPLFLVAPDRSSSVTVPAAVWDPTATPRPSDWLVFRLDPSAPSATAGPGLAASS